MWLWIVLLSLFCGTAPSAIPHGWAHHSFVSLAEPVHLRISLHVPNPTLLKSRFDAVSDPDHPHYGKYLSAEELTGLVGSPDSVLDQVKAWITPHSPLSMTLAATRDSLRVSLPVSKASGLLGGVTFERFHHARTNSFHVAARGAYKIPDHLSPHIHVITGVHDFPLMPLAEDSPLGPVTLDDSDTTSGAPSFDAVLSGDGEFALAILVFCQDGSAASTLPPLCGGTLASFQVQLKPFDSVTAATIDMTVPVNMLKCYQRLVSEFGPMIECYVPVAHPSIVNYQGYTISVRASFTQTFSGWVTYGRTLFATPYASLQNLRNLYGIPSGFTTVTNKASLGVVEFHLQQFNPSYFADFVAWNGDPPPVPVTLTGNLANNETNFGKEASLDIQYVTLARNTSLFFELFVHGPVLDFISWCSYLGASSNPPLVHSISYGLSEFFQTRDYLERTSTEFMKLALRGISILVAAGDDGAGGPPAKYELKENKPTACTKFDPIFPASSPYITSVGATILSDRVVPIHSMHAGTARIRSTRAAEVVCSSDTGGKITSGGGFSNGFPMPDYQKAAVAAYLASGVVLPPSSMYKPSMRAYPDISALGHSFPVNLPIGVNLGSEKPWPPGYLNGTLFPYDGTSASAPVAASIISMLNELRGRNNQPPLGFLNPWIYKVAAANPTAFKDVLQGSNRCVSRQTTGNNGIIYLPCCPYGWNATVGWDPASGFGSPNFPALASLVLSPNNPFPGLVVTGQQGEPGPVGSSMSRIPALWAVAFVLLATMVALSVALWRQTATARELSDGPRRARTNDWSNSMSRLDD